MTVGKQAKQMPDTTVETTFALIMNKLLDFMQGTHGFDKLLVFWTPYSLKNELRAYLINTFCLPIWSSQSMTTT